MKEFLLNPNTWLSIATIIVAVIALFLTIWQIGLSNKQQLFDKRLDKYLFVLDLLSTYKNAESTLDYDMSLDVEFQFALLTNCGFMENITDVIQKPIHHHLHKDFLKKLEEIERNATEIELLWNSKDAKYIAEFVSLYRKLLQSIYRQQIYLQPLKKQNETSPITLEKAQEDAKNSAERVGLFVTITKIKEVYQKIEQGKLQEKLKGSIKL